jgi:PAS domain S-box-containing protein
VAARGEAGTKSKRAQPPVDLSELLNLAFDAIFVRTFLDRRIIYWNRAAESLYGFTAAEALGKIPGDLLRTQYPIPLEAIEQTLADTGRWEGRLLQFRRDDTQIPVNGRWALRRDPEGRPDAIVEINSDASTEFQAQEKLGDSEARFRLLVEAVQDYAIFMLDQDGYIRSWNAGAARIKGYSAEEAIGKHFSIFYPPEDIASDKPGKELVIAGAQGRLEDEGWRLRKDGSRFWANVVITALYDGSGKLTGFGKVTRDLTKQKRAEEQLLELRAREAAQLAQRAERAVELEQAKSRLLNLASHELRGPLAVLRGYISMIADGTIPPERLPSIAPILVAKATQMNSLVQQMLESARLDDSRMQLSKRLVDVRRVVDAAVEEFRPLLPPAQQIVVHADGAVVAEADPGRLQTIVSNLVDNAIKYSLGHGPIVVTVGAQHGNAQVAVRDQGPGLTPEQMGRLFGRFERILTPENQHIPGTGLGLHLSRELARLHGGELTARSAPGLGSEFLLSVPLVPAAEPAEISG